MTESGFHVDARVPRDALIAAVAAELSLYVDVARTVVITPEDDGTCRVRISPDLPADAGYIMAAFLRGYQAAAGFPV